MVLQHRTSLGAAVLLIASATLPANAAMIGFESGEGYTASSILGGQPTSGTQWARTNGSDITGIQVTAGAGSGGTAGITPRQGDASNFTYYRFAALDADLGGTFDAASSLVEYSFDWRATQALDGPSGTNIFSFVVGSNDNAGANSALTLNIRANGRLAVNDGTTTRVVDGLLTTSTPVSDTPFRTISGKIDYATKTFTVFVNAVQQFTSFNGGNLSFNNSSAANPWVQIANLSADTIPANANYRTWAADNVKIAIVPEPATLGLAALAGLACLRRRR